jgi:thiol:disulfide interchange protein
MKQPALPLTNLGLNRPFLSLGALLFLTLATLLFAGISKADDPFAKNSSPVANSILTQQDEFLPVDQAFIPSYRIEQGQLLLQWEVTDGYYLYEERFKFRTQDGTTITPTYTAGKMKYDELFERETMVHYHQVIASIDLANFPSPFTLKLEYQGCANAGLCYPPQKRLLAIDPAAGSVTQATDTPTPTVATASTPTPEEPNQTSGTWLFKAILFAILGGMILNLMPCVFPVLSIKVMSLAAADRKRLALHGWVYTLGIMACFVGFAIALLIARKGGEAIGWGFQLQSPGLIAALAYLFFVMGLSMSGLIYFGTSFMGVGQGLAQKSGLSGSFFTGVLAAVVASPCTAPFMGAALGFALTQPAIACLAVFAALGFGMALPLLLLCYIPALAERLPRPGAWMDNIKQFLAFPLYLSAVWLLWVYGRQTSTTGMAALCTGAVAIAFGCWLMNRHGKGITEALRLITIAAAWIIALALPFKELNQHNAGDAQTDGQWQVYTSELLQSLRAEGRPVFVNLTADWCLTCLANERIALDTKTIKTLFKDNNVATLKGDWTNTDPKITELLEEYGRSGVPLYLWFPANRSGKADVLPQLLTKDMLINTISSKN